MSKWCRYCFVHIGIAGKVCNSWILDTIIIRCFFFVDIAIDILIFCTIDVAARIVFVKIDVEVLLSTREY